MPTYDYKCDKCENTFEVFQSFSEDPLTDCPDKECSGPVKKIFSAPGISFKGSGFYKNDSRSSSSKTSTSQAPKSSPDDSKSSDSSKEKKKSPPPSPPTSTDKQTT